TAQRLYELGLIDEVLEEPLGGAHRDAGATSQTLKAAVIRHLDELEKLSIEEVRARRSARMASIGVYSEEVGE
ncbi:MAG: acetyl-CoA carboxylase carboxyl transferase subunit alpha, partial [Steroidobacteraceae bacterium]